MKSLATQLCSILVAMPILMGSPRFWMTYISFPPSSRLICHMHCLRVSQLIWARFEFAGGRPLPPGRWDPESGAEAIASQRLAASSLWAC